MQVRNRERSFKCSSQAKGEMERQIEQCGMFSDRQTDCPKAEEESDRVDVSMIQQYSGRG